MYKRYFTITSKTGDPFLESYVTNLLQNSPELRDSVLNYYKRLGYSKKRYQQLIDFLSSTHCVCDVSTFSISKLLVDWEIPNRSTIVDEIVKVATQFLKREKSKSQFISTIWLLAKYGSEKDLFSAIWSYREIWESSSFLARQIAALMPILREDREHSFRIENIFIETGHLDAIRVLKNLEVLREKGVSKDFNMYLSQRNQGVYPLQKFLILIDILNSNAIKLSIKQELKARLLDKKIITDRIYIHKLNKIDCLSDTSR